MKSVGWILSSRLLHKVCRLRTTHTFTSSKHTESEICVQSFHQSFVYFSSKNKNGNFVFKFPQQVLFLSFCLSFYSSEDTVLLRVSATINVLSVCSKSRPMFYSRSLQTDEVLFPHFHKCFVHVPFKRVRFSFHVYTNVLSAFSSNG